MKFSIKKMLNIWTKNEKKEDICFVFQGQIKLFNFISKVKKHKQKSQSYSLDLKWHKNEFYKIKTNQVRTVRIYAVP